VGSGLLFRAGSPHPGTITSSRSRRENEDLRRAIQVTGEHRLHFEPFDLCRTEKVPAFVKELRNAFGAIYGLINNAAISYEGLLANMRNSDIEALLLLNVLSPIILTKYVVRHMMAEGAGRIVNISSIIASSGHNGLSAYAASKAAVSGFTRSLAREVGRVGITVNAIAPGFVDTDLTRSLSEEDRRRIAGRSALRRLPEADDVGSVVQYLLGEAGRNITGTIVSARNTT
jgi:3-oxoacyl-[acyl-carrier protein] reductase